MAALTTDRNTFERAGDYVVLPVAAGVTLYAGALAALDAGGNVTPGATATTLKGIGRCEEFIDNSAGIAGAVTVKVKKGVFAFANSAAADLITTADIGSNCFIVDDQTVAKTDGTGTRSVAGVVFDVNTDGVWIKF